MRFPHALLTLVAAASVSGCSYRQVLEKVAPKDDVQFATDYLSHLRAGDLDEVERHLDPALVTSATRGQLAQVAALFPRGEPTSVELIGANVGRGPGWSSSNLSFQYRFEEGWVAASVLVQHKDGVPLTVGAVHANRLPDSLQRIHAFTLRGKRIVHYAFLAGALLVPCFQLAVLIACVRARDVRRKWRWALFILLGVGGATINWTTGQAVFLGTHVQLLGAGASTTSPYSPWLVTISFPLGALVYLAKRTWGDPARAAAPESPPAPGLD